MLDCEERQQSQHRAGSNQVLLALRSVCVSFIRLCLSLQQLTLIRSNLRKVHELCVSTRREVWHFCVVVCETLLFVFYCCFRIRYCANNKSLKYMFDNLSVMTRTVPNSFSLLYG